MEFDPDLEIMASSAPIMRAMFLVLDEQRKQDTAARKVAASLRAATWRYDPSVEAAKPQWSRLSDLRNDHVSPTVASPRSFDDDIEPISESDDE